MAYKGYVNKDVKAMYGIPYSQLTAEQKRILREDSKRRAELIEETQKQVMKNNLKAFEDEAKLEKTLASIYKDCQKQILADVAETIAKVEKDGGTWSYANQSALTRSRGLFEQIDAELTKLGKKEQLVFTQGLGNIYTDQFLRQVYEIGQSIPVKANFNRLNPALVKRTLDYPWSGAMFSDRIWQDKATLGRNLRVGLTQSMILGESIQKLAERINKNIGTAQYNAERLARTETKRVTYVAHNDAYEDMGIEELKYYTSGMKSASEVCGTCKKDNGKIYKRGEEPTLPRHPNCKCVYIPVVRNKYKNGELNELTHSVRGAENYEKWINANRDKINPDGSLKDGWVRDWKNGGKLVNKNATRQGESYAEALDQLDIEYKAKSNEITALRNDIEAIRVERNQYSSVRRGVTDPKSVGFEDMADFEAWDQNLADKAKKLREKMLTAQDELNEFTRDRQYLLLAGEDKLDTLKDYRTIREALKKVGGFDNVKYGDELMETIARMDLKDITLQAQMYRNGAKVSWRGLSPAQVFKNGAISDVRLKAELNGVANNVCKKLKDVLSGKDIINRLAGGDMTSGSCSSLAFAYIGNRMGIDVLDFRGGKSQSFFANHFNITMMADLPNVKSQTIMVKKEAGDTAKLLNKLELDKEYYLAVGRHASIVKNTKDGVMYLELQSGRQNGWMPLGRYGSEELTMQKRFGCRKTVDRALGKVWEKPVFLLEVDSFKDNVEFEKVLGYINTDPDKQRKGASGSVK